MVRNSKGQDPESKKVASAETKKKNLKGGPFTKKKKGRKKKATGRKNGRMAVTTSKKIATKILRKKRKKGKSAVKKGEIYCEPKREGSLPKKSERGSKTRRGAASKERRKAQKEKDFPEG